MGDSSRHDAGVRCTACDHASRHGARFCVRCGSPLPVACAACDTVLPDDARFCDTCGRSVDPEADAGAGATPVEAERRLSSP
jgi:rRNA maturation endonuclease Nob1